MNIVEVKISDIKIGDRHRKDMGDLQSLAESMRREQFQSIGVTPELELVFGLRRLLAARDILGWETISARIVSVTSILRGEIEENCLRKDYSPSELVAIIQTLRSFTHGGDRRSDQVRNCDLETLTTEQAARMVGWSKDTFARASKVLDQGVPEVVEAMDNRTLSVSAASTLAAAKPQEQRIALAEMPSESKLTAVEVRRQLRRLSADHTDDCNPSRNGDNTETPFLLCEWIFERLDEGGVHPETILDPSAGQGNLTRPFRESRVIAYEIGLGKDFFKVTSIDCDLVVCNPPWSEAETWLPHIVTVVGKVTPMVYFCPAMYFIGYADRRFRQFLESPKAPTLSHITPLPIDTFQDAHGQGVILWLNLPSLRNVALLPSRCLVRNSTTTPRSEISDVTSQQFADSRSVANE